MPLGWIDFSKSERNKVLGVLDLLMESGTLDELGIAPVRDGFANLFFPGTSTIQTRAKYFLIVPYALKDLEYNNETNPNSCLVKLNDIERQCGIKLLEFKKDTDGVIGSRSLGQGGWVKRTPSDIYWAGLRSYGIFSAGGMTSTEYMRTMCALKSQKTDMLKLGNRNDDSEEKDSDDKDAGILFRVKFLNIPTYNPKWMDNLNIKLTSEEGVFLKRQIIQSFPDSMLAFMLKNDMTEIMGCKRIKELESIIHVFPEQIRSDYALAIAFSDFLYVVRVLYNIIVTDNQSDAAEEEWAYIKDELERRSSVDLESIFNRLQIHRNPSLCKFLRRCQSLMKTGDVEGLKIEIRRRERELKQNRSKTAHPGEFDSTVWYGGGELDYRFSNAKVIIKDIWESEGLC